jgi:hypothetical protein
VVAGTEAGLVAALWAFAASEPFALLELFEAPQPASIATAVVVAVAAPSSVRIRMVVPPDGEH